MFTYCDGDDDSSINTNLEGIWIAKSLTINCFPEEGSSPCNHNAGSYTFSYSDIESIRGIHLNQNYTYWKNFEYNEDVEENSPIGSCECELPPFLCEDEGVYSYEDLTLSLCSEFNDTCIEQPFTLRSNGNELILLWGSSPPWLLQRDCEDVHPHPSDCCIESINIYLDRY